MQFHFPLDRSLSTGSYIQENSLLKEKKCNGIFLPFILRFLHRGKKKVFQVFSKLLQNSGYLQVGWTEGHDCSLAGEGVGSWLRRQRCGAAPAAGLVQLPPAGRTLPAAGIAAGPAACLSAVHRVLSHSFQLLVFGLKAWGMRRFVDRLWFRQRLCLRTLMWGKKGTVQLMVGSRKEKKGIK